MSDLESTIAHGYLSARVEGYAAKRARLHAGPPARTGPNVSGWQQLAAMYPEHVQHGGERLVH